MKQVLLIFSFLFCLSISGHSQGTSGPPRTSIKKQSVEVLQNTTTIEIRFLQELGNVNLSVENSEGINIYGTTTNATIGSSLAIDFAQWPDGTYTLCIFNNNGVLIETFIVRKE